MKKETKKDYRNTLQNIKTSHKFHKEINSWTISKSIAHVTKGITIVKTNIVNTVSNRVYQEKYI